MERKAKKCKSKRLCKIGNLKKRKEINCLDGSSKNLRRCRKSREEEKSQRDFKTKKKKKKYIGKFVQRGKYTEVKGDKLFRKKIENFKTE